MSAGRVLFLYENEVPFVHSDLAILREKFEVYPVNCSQGIRMGSILRALARSELSYSWFALGYAARAVLAGKILRRPSVVVSGGWDIISMPEISYGAIQSRRGRLRARFVLRYANMVMTFSQWSRASIQNLARRRVELVYIGVDLDRFRPNGVKEDLVVTVGNVTRENFKRKGLETFVRAAHQLPDVPFVLVGRHSDPDVEELRALSPSNVHFTGWLPAQELSDLLARAKVYVQASYNEGFGLALAEAMASGCVPVVTDRGALPEVAGNVGFYVPYGDPQSTAVAIRDALSSPDRGPRARERTAELFSLAARRERLLESVESLLQG